MKRLGLYLFAGLALLDVTAWSARADFIEISPSQVNTLVEFPQSKSQTGLFAGLSGQSGINRGLLEFNLAGSIPIGSTIESVTLSMYLLSAGSGPTSVTIGLQDAGKTWAGAGSPPAANWTYNINPTSKWTNLGGDFSATVSSSLTVNKNTGNWFTWSSTPATVADAQSWLDNPSTNFGWFVIGDETDTFSVRRFSLDSGTVPVLGVTYAPPVPEPASAVLLATGAVLAGAGVWRRRQKGLTSPDRRPAGN